MQNKAVNFNPGNQTNAVDEAKAVKGRKKHLGDPDTLEAARRTAREKEGSRRKLGVLERKKRKRAAIEAGAELSYVLPLYMSPRCLNHEQMLNDFSYDRYDRLKPLHHLHTLYLVNLLNLPRQAEAESSGLRSISSAEAVQSKLSKADYTGARLCVTCARNRSLDGIEGIVIEETASTFRLLTPASTVKVVPKNGTQFELSFPAFAPPSPSSVPGEGEDGSYRSTILPIPPDKMEHYIHTTPRLSIPLLGTNFGFRSGDRAGRKFRPTQGGGGGSGWGEEWVKGEWSEIFGMLERGDDRDGDDAKSRKAKGRSQEGEKPAKRKRGKARRKDPPAFGSLQVQ